MEEGIFFCPPGNLRLMDLVDVSADPPEVHPVVRGPRALYGPHRIRSNIRTYRMRVSADHYHRKRCEDSAYPPEWSNADHFDESAGEGGVAGQLEGDS